MKNFLTFSLTFILWCLISSNQIFAQTYASTNATSAKIVNLEEIHLVQEGEHLAMITKKYGVKIQDVRTWNGLTSDKLSIGQQLKIFLRHVEETHKVMPNENIQEIARFYDVTPNKILEWNNLNQPSDVKENVVLKIYILKK